MADDLTESEPKSASTARQERIAFRIASGEGVTAIAEDCKMTRPTIYGWLKKPEFRERVEELRKAITQQGVDRLSGLLAGKAVDALEGLLDDKSANVRLESVKTVVESLINIMLTN